MVTVIVIFCAITAFLTFNSIRVRYTHRFFDSYREIIGSEKISEESLDTKKKFGEMLDMKESSDNSLTFETIYRMARWFGYDIVLVREKDVVREQPFVFSERKNTRMKMAGIKMRLYKLFLKYRNR